MSLFTIYFCIYFFKECFYLCITSKNHNDSYRKKILFGIERKERKLKNIISSSRFNLSYTK